MRCGDRGQLAGRSGTEVISEIHPMEKWSVSVVPGEPAGCFVVHVERSNAKALLVRGGVETEELLAFLEPLMWVGAVKSWEGEFE